jgi:hypothetical protein
VAGEIYELSAEREDIAGFLEELEALLNEALHGPEARSFFSSELLAELRAAWDELPAVFDEVRLEVLSPAPDREPEIVEGLQRVRLFGRQLSMKLHGWATAANEFWRQKTGSLLSAALGWGNVILGSLAGVVGAAEGIKEFKEAVEAARDTTEALGHPEA